MSPIRVKVAVGGGMHGTSSPGVAGIHLCLRFANVLQLGRLRDDLYLAGWYRGDLEER